MRLGQLARKLAIRPSEIVEFLAAHNISLDESSNTRLEDDQVILIMKEFAPDSGDTVVARVAADTPIAAEETPGPNEATGVEDKSAEELSPPSHVEEVKVEVIKAPKVELSGLKVVGKIDLPEPKKKDPPAAGIESADQDPRETEKKAQPEGKKSPYKKEKQEQRPVRKNPIALQREREAQEAERKRQEKAKQEKEQRTKNYYNKVRASAPTKRVKMVEDPTTEMSAAELKQTPRTWVGRFFNWLKT